jgi:hypothetical protein
LLDANKSGVAKVLVTARDECEILEE